MHVIHYVLQKVISSISPLFVQALIFEGSINILNKNVR
jgi:hypothetical protein